MYPPCRVLYARGDAWFDVGLKMIKSLVGIASMNSKYALDGLYQLEGTSGKRLGIPRHVRYTGTTLFCENSSKTVVYYQHLCYMFYK